MVRPRPFKMVLTLNFSDGCGCKFPLPSQLSGENLGCSHFPLALKFFFSIYFEDSSKLIKRTRIINCDSMRGFYLRSWPQFTSTY